MFVIPAKAGIQGLDSGLGEHWIADKRGLRHIKKWLTCGVPELGIPR